MSDSQFRRRTLESLKKEAKRWLSALEAHDPLSRARYERVAPLPPTLNLRLVQHALAVEHGFTGWAELKSTLAAQAGQTAQAMREFEESADCLLEAYRSGTPEAMARHWARTWHRRTHSAMRTYVQLDLGRQAGSVNQNDDITRDDARMLVAREHGFASWDTLAKFYTTTPVSQALLTAKPVRVLLPKSLDSSSTDMHSREWPAVLEMLRAGRGIGIDAAGQMTDSMLEDLSSIEHLQLLMLGGSKNVTDAGLRHLTKLPRLRHLDLRQTAITDGGLSALSTLTELETISLAWTDVTDIGAAFLANCPRLVDVNLIGTATGDGAIRALVGKAHLRQLKTGNALTDAGLELLADIPVFRHWHGGEPKLALLSYDSGPNNLLLRGPFTDRGMAHLEKLEGLFGLNIDSSELSITEAGLAPLVGLPNLGWLAVDAKDSSMPYIARMRRLRFLGCQDTAAGDAGFAALSASQSIEYIWGRRCHNLRTAGFAALAQMPALRGLSVSCKNVEDAGVATLPTFPALRELMPMDVPDAGYRHIAKCKALESLVLMYCRETGDAATEHIAHLPALKKYFASYNRITDRTPELLSRMDSLEEITFSACAGITDAGLLHLMRLPNLRELRVSGPRITPGIQNAFPPKVRVFYEI